METPEPSHDPQRAPFNSAKHDRLCQIGLWLGVLGAGLAAVPGFSDGSVAEQGFRAVFFQDAAFITAGAFFAVLIGLSVVLPFAWARITGIGLLATAAATYGIMVVGARADEDILVRDVTVTLGPAGKMLVIAFTVTTLGLVFALVGAPRMGRKATLNSSGEPVHGTSGYAITSLVLSLCGLFTGVTAALGIAFAVAAFDDGEQSKGARGGRGMAIAGLVVGLVIVVLGALFMAALLGTADPSLNESSS